MIGRVIPKVDIAVIGAGAAGLMAAIWAKRTYPALSVVALDGARKIGAKILVAGGGRCNVTHDEVSEAAYAGSSRNAIKKVLRRFDVTETIAFFRELGVELKREPTGKLFPVTDDAHTVLDALLNAAKTGEVVLQHPCRIESIEKSAENFSLRGDWGTLTAQKVILATGGKSLPKSGSDGHGYTLAQALGHSLTPRIFPALVPLTLPRDHFITTLSGITIMAALTVRTSSGETLVTFHDSTLCTHFGLSGPSVLDISRYYLDARHHDPGALLTINWLPDKTSEQVESELLGAGKRSILRYLDILPERLARALCAEAEIEPATTTDSLSRSQRKRLVDTLTQLVLPITGDRGFTYAEVTAGGIPLTEINLKTMESRLCPGLYLAGEICDVDGRIGGYNFQWAWASGYTAGVSVGLTN